MKKTVDPIIQLHVHSEYSLLDGSIRTKDLINRAKQLGQTHCALTDHGNMHGAVEFYLEAKKAGIIPIVGCEVYHQGQAETLELAKEMGKSAPEVGAFHLPVLAENTQGYHSLLKLVSSGYLDGNYEKVPIISEKSLDRHNQNIVALSGCLKGEMGFWIKEMRKAHGQEGPLAFAVDHKLTGPMYGCLSALVQKMLKRFGKGNFYVELSHNNLPGQINLLPDLVAAAEHFQLPIVATADIHYLDKDFMDTHALAVAIKNSLTLNHIKGRLRNAQFHFPSNEEMHEHFSQWPEALKNTQKIAAQCSSLEIKMDTYFLPKIDLGNQESPKMALQRLAHAGLQERFHVLKKSYGDELNESKMEEYRARLNYELKVIIQMGFPDYFLIVQDFINWAKRNGIPVGPGRGSGAGSLVAYALKITDLDPIPYNLIFERFLNPERVSMPDFDVDFCQWRREEVIQYCVQKYGSENVAQITTFGKMQAKGAIKSVGRAMNLGYTRVDQFTKLFPPDLGITLKDALEQEPRLQEEMEKDDALKECMNSALQLEGLASHTSVHAAGLVISDGSMTNYVPVYTVDGNSYITQYEMKPTEKVGLVKFDFLGLKTLTVIDKAVHLIKNSVNAQININDIPLDDAKVYEMLSLGHTVGIFQCESAGITQLILKLKPSTFEDVIALVALFRPGPLGSGMVDDFVERKHGRQKITYPHPSLEPILKDTYGMILYQEQVQKIAAVLANYSLGEADLLRRAMGKKIPEEMAKQKSRFISGALENSIEHTLAEEIFDLMAEFAKYGFNKSHSAAYGLVSYQTAFLKTHYPEQFLAASMTCDMDHTDKLVRYVEDCLRCGFEVLPPNINRSFKDFDVPGKNKVGFALAAIKGVGETVLQALILEREQKGTYKDLIDLSHRLNLSNLGKKTLQLLITAGALDSFGYARKDLEKIVPELVSYSQKYHEAKSMGQRSLFAFAPEGELKEKEQFTGATWESEIEKAERSWEMTDLFEEKKLIGTFLSGHPLDFYKADLKSFGAYSLKRLHELPVQNRRQNQGRGNGLKVGVVALLSSLRYRRTKKGTLMAYVRLEEGKDAIEAVMFEDKLKSIGLPEENTAVFATGQVEHSEQYSLRFTLENIQSLEEIRQERIKKITILVRAADYGENAQQWCQQFKNLLTTWPGPTPVVVKLDFPHAQASIDLSQMAVEVSNTFLLELDRLSAGRHGISYTL